MPFLALVEFGPYISMKQEHFLITENGKAQLVSCQVPHFITIKSESHLQVQCSIVQYSLFYCLAQFSIINNSVKSSSLF